MSLRHFIAGILLFALGAGAGSWYAKRGEAREPPREEAIAKLQRLAEADLEEYYRLQASREKFRKADEILGKIMTIFLADLGLHVSRHAVDASKKEPPPARAPEPIARVAPAPIAAKPGGSSPSGGDSAHQRLAERRIGNARTEEELAADLRRVRLPDLNDSIRQSVPFTNAGNLLSSLNGQFSGLAQLRYDNGAHEWEVQLTIQGSSNGGKVSGTTHVRVLEQGILRVDSTLRGPLPGIRETKGNAQGFFLQAGSNVYFQLFYVRELDQLAGNVYRSQTGAQNFLYAGTVALRRNN